jgi:RNA polymerase sigma-70 factor (ECF subfamily)
MDPTPSFEELAARLQAGDAAAVESIHERFAQRLIALARARLDKALQPKLDPEDVLQSVFSSFVTRQADGQIDLYSWDSLWGLLVVMTLRKCKAKAKFFHRAARDVRRENETAPESPLGKGGSESPAREPTPLEAAELADTLENLMQRLTPRERQVATLRLQGHSVYEISSRIGRTERTVERALERARYYLEQLQPEGETPS